MANQVKKATDIPPLDEEGKDFVNWILRVRKWCKISKEDKKALCIQVALGPKAFQATKHIDEEKLDSEEGVDILLETLEKHFIPDKLRNRINMFRKHNELKRTNESVLDFIDEYMNLFNEYRSLIGEMPYDDSTLALLLLTSCNLGDEERLISAQMKEPPASDDVISILKRVYSNPNQKNIDQERDDELNPFEKSERGHDAMDSTHATLYTRDKRGVYYRRRSRSPHRSSHRSRSPRYSRSERRNQSSNINDKTPRKNSIGPDGRHMECRFCKSIWHFINDCQEFEKMKKEYYEQKSHEVNLSF